MQNEAQMLKEFKEFALRGNVVDLAVGVIVGAAFGKIVESVVGDLIMPVVGAIFGGLDFSNYFLGLSSAVTAPTLAEAKKQGAVLAYGSFLTVAVNFLILAFILFLAVRGVNSLRKQEQAAPAAPPPPPRSEALLAEIRDLLARK
jgi:large conductance mechanosensitive channel